MLGVGGEVSLHVVHMTACLIAQIAIEHEIPLLHDDRDFLAISGIEPKLQIDPSSGV